MRVDIDGNHESRYLIKGTTSERSIHTDSHSHGIKANGFVFISGQLAWDPATGKLVAGGIEAQTEQVLENLTAVLAAGGSDWEKVLNCLDVYRGVFGNL